jgi:hypothetical protein
MRLSGPDTGSDWLFFRCNHVSFAKNRAGFRFLMRVFGDIYVGECCFLDHGNLGLLGRAIKALVGYLQMIVLDRGIESG